MIAQKPHSVVIPLDKQGRPKGVYRIDGNGKRKKIYDAATIRKRAGTMVEVEIDIGLDRKGRPVPVLASVVADGGEKDTALSRHIGAVMG